MRSFLAALLALATTLAGALPAGARAAAPPARDGSHDFDFNIGVWHTHITRILQPFAANSPRMTLDGTVTVRPVWCGRASLEEIEADGPRGHWEGLTLFLYDPRAHQWSQSYIDSASGELETPTVGSFANGRGDLYAQDTDGDASILVRGEWSDITPTSHSYIISYSRDGGATWKAAFIAKLTRLAWKPKPLPDAADRQRDFDFDLGTWTARSTRLLRPLTGSTRWVPLASNVVISKVWGGRANLVELNGTGPTGTEQLVALRWYNPKARQWNLDFATPSVGTLGIPGFGTFHHGRIDFYDQEPYDGRRIWVRFSIWDVDANHARSEQAFSPDGGKTWEVNWKTRYTRVTPTRRSPAAWK
ncbi:MAG TPA: hypothetical protein VMD91_00270 [Candidatus Sulfotelmatobacter sp.]|nr:hypothetical protein [Candidatus Sulfotelmatobacter sp.]